MCLCFKIVANWWGVFGGSSPNLRRIAIRILSLTISSSGCERNWSTFEGVSHSNTKCQTIYLKYNHIIICIFLTVYCFQLCRFIPRKEIDWYQLD